MTTTMHKIALILFVLALLHTFATRLFEVLAHRHPRHAGLFHLLGEVEVVFGFWAFVLMLALACVDGTDAAIDYAESRHYTEPLFVFVVMVVAASRPVLEAGRAPKSAHPPRGPRRTEKKPTGGGRAPPSCARSRGCCRCVRKSRRRGSASRSCRSSAR